jgi:hypothetical protein
VTKQPMSPEEAQKVADRALQHVACGDCGAGPGEPCTGPGRGRSVCKSRFVVAAIALRTELRDAGRTPEQEAVLAGLPKIPKAEFAAITTERGGLRTTKEWFVEHGLPYPPIPGWRKAVEAEEE